MADSQESSGINTKVGPKNKHIRYRESKLTYLLRDALGGNSKTVMICNVNPHIEALKETRSTLLFAQRAKMIKNTAVVNEENTSDHYWKDRYHELLRANSLHPHRTLTSGNSSSGVDSLICTKCKNSTAGEEL